MAWMPVAEAAARLGVSERTIWRRIKSETIPSRSEGGRTLVDFDPSLQDGAHSTYFSHSESAAPARDPLSHDALHETVASLGDQQVRLATELKRVRRERGLLMALVAVLGIAVAIGLWQQRTTVQEVRAKLDRALAQDDENPTEPLLAIQAETARANATAAAQADELSRLREGADGLRTELAKLVASRDELQCIIDERLEAVGAELARRTDSDSAWDAERAALARTIDELRASLHQKEIIQLAAQQQSERITEALRRHAAKNAGLAEGLRIHIDLQQQVLAQAQAELDDLRAVLAGAASTDNPLHELALRRSMRAAVFGAPSGADSATANRGLAVASWQAPLARMTARLRSWVTTQDPSPAPVPTQETLAHAEALSIE